MFVIKEEYYTPICRSFNKSALTYDQYSHVQKQACHALLRLITSYSSNSNSVETAVDFGCGTGYSTLQLFKTTAPQRCIGVDIAAKLLAIAKAEKKLVNRQQRIAFTQANFDREIFQRNSISIAFANMSLQWGYDLTATIETISSQLDIGGILAFSIPLDGTFNELKENYRNNFYLQKEVEEILALQRLAIINSNCLEFVDAYSSHHQALLAIKGVGANIIKPFKHLPNKKLTTSFSGYFHSDSDITLTQKIGLFVARKL